MKLSLTLIICFLLTSIVVFPFYFIGEVPGNGCCGGTAPVTHDGAMHLNQMQAFERGLAAGRLYPRWDAETHRGYGAPIFSFYPPGAYYLTSLLFWLQRDWLWTQAAFYWTAMAASGLALYALARRLLAPVASLIATAVYLVAPYHLINQYQRGALAEQLSFIWAPLMLLWIERSLAGEERQERRWINLIPLAATCGAFLWSHPPTAYQFFLIFGPWIAFALWRAPRRSSVLVLCACFFGLMLAAAYFLPALLEQPLINADDVERSWPYHASYVFDEAQKYYDHRDDFIARIDRIWAFNAVILMATSWLSWRSKDRRARLWLIAAGWAIFLMTKYSAPVGRLIPQIEIGVFAWRLLALVSMSIALLSGVLWQSKRSKTLSRAAALLILLGSIGMSFWYVVKPMYRAEAFRPRPEHYNYATLPRGVPRLPPEMNAVELAQGRFTIEHWAPEFRQVSVELDRPDRLNFRLSNFPGWTATVDGQIVPIIQRDDGGVTIDAPAGIHLVALEFRSTVTRKISNWITLFSLTMLMFFAVKSLFPRITP